MEDILRVVCPPCSPPSPAAHGGHTDGAEDTGTIDTTATKPGSISSNHLERRLKVVHDLKHALVGNEGAKVEAMRLGIVEELLSFLDAAAADGTAYDSSLLQAIGLVSILTTSPAAPDALIPSCSKLLEHVREGLGYHSDRTTATILRMLSAMHTILFRREGWFLSTKAPTARAETNITPLLKEISLQVLQGITNNHGQQWSPRLRNLAAAALATVTRDPELARNLVPAVVDSGTTLLRPLIAFTSEVDAQGSQGPNPNPLGWMEGTYARDMELPTISTTPTVLEILANLSIADPPGVAAWLTNCTPRWSPWGALKGLEVELNSRHEKVRILAGLVLINCFKGKRNGCATSGAARTAGVHPPTTCKKSAWEDFSPSAPHALDAVIAHRVLPLFFRTLRSWAELPAALSFSAVCYVGHATAVAEAMGVAMKLEPWQRQGEAVAYGAVDSLVTFLRRARSAAAAVVTPSSGGGSDGRGDSEEASPLVGANGIAPPAKSGEGEVGVLVVTMRAALEALATVCAICESARGRVVTLGFHCDVVSWLDEQVGSTAVSSGGGVQLEPLELFRNLGRSCVSCSAIVAAGAFESLIGVVRAITVIADGEFERLALAAAGLTNMALEHEVVKEAISRSECLRTICKTAVNTSAPEHVRTACVSLLCSTCFLAPLHVRVGVSFFLGGVGGMLALLDAPRENDLLLKSLKTLRNLLHAVPLRTLDRVERQTSPGDSTGGGDGAEPTAVRLAEEAPPMGGVRFGRAEQAQTLAATGVAQHIIPRDAMPSTWEPVQMDLRMWREWRDRHPGEAREVGSSAAGRHLWGELETSPPRDSFHGSIRNHQNDRPQPIEDDFQPGRRFHRSMTERRMGPWMSRGRGHTDWGLTKLVEAISCTLEGAPTGEGCDETSCAALRLLLTLATAHDCQLAALQTRRVLEVIKPHLLPGDAHQRDGHGYFQVSSPLPVPPLPSLGLASPRPPCVTADATARLLLAQLVPRQADSNIAIMLAAFAATGASSSSSEGAGANENARGRGQGTRSASAAWCPRMELNQPGRERTGRE